MQNAIVLLTALSTNTWNAIPGDIVVCDTADEKARLIAAEFGRELETDEPTKKQTTYRMADAHAPAPIVVKDDPKPAKVKKAANDDDDEFDESKPKASEAKIAPKRKTASKSAVNAE